MNRALVAHERLLQKLKDRIRTHVQDGSLQHVRGQKYSREQKAQMRSRLVRMRAAGMNRREMCLALQTTAKTIASLIGNAGRGRTRTPK